MLPLTLLLAGLAAAEPLAPRPVLPTVSQARAEAALLGGVDSWPEEQPGVGELRVGLGYARSLGAGSVAVRYGGVLQAWQERYALDGHLLELAADAGGTLAGGGLASLRGSALWGWSETSLAGSLRFSNRRIWSRASAGVVTRSGGDASATGLGLGAQANLRVTPQLSAMALVEGRSWWTEDFPAAYVEADLGVAWDAGRLSLASGVGISAAAGGADDAWVAGLPPSGLATGRAWLSPEVELSEQWSVLAEASAEYAGEDYARARAMIGLRGRFGRVKRSGLQPAEVGRARFELEVPGAERVEVMGSFTQWEPVPMQQVSPGRWSLDLPLEPGEHLYAYLVDGQAVAPPEALRHRPDGFGGENGVLVIAGEPAAEGPTWGAPVTTGEDGT